ncbi:helix-turn-helix transcriptional regulator [Gorillibacterium sp. CAU 1737]|uniref:helix-turn-helix domain-containing protein n=1 Tax=Gorillibacterium sp. CAU 1737 TaxID=3140362 RepID=UPI003260018D
MVHQEYLMVTGIAIGAERRWRGMKQEELAASICSERTLRDVEKGTRLVKDATYEQLLTRLGYSFANSLDALLEISRLIEWVYEWEEEGSGCVPAELEEALTRFEPGGDVVLEQLLRMLLGLLHPEPSSKQDRALLTFLAEAFPCLPPALQELSLLYRFHGHTNADDSSGVEEAVRFMKSSGRPFSANILCRLIHMADRKDYLATLNELAIWEETWTREAKLFPLLKAYEYSLLPVWYTTPADFDAHVKKTVSTLNQIRERGLPLTREKESNSLYNIGLSCTYARNYEQAYRHLSRSVQLWPENPFLMNSILMEYTRCRLVDLGRGEGLASPEFRLIPEPHRFRAVFHYFYYKQQKLMDERELQAYIQKELIEDSVDDQGILYRVMLYELLKLSDVTHSYLPLKVWIESADC